LFATIRPLLQAATRLLGLVRHGGRQHSEVTAGRGGINWRLTRPIRFSEGEHRISARLRGSVNEMDREADLATGKVTHSRSKPKGVVRSHEIRFRVRF
jgi:hypothetical protein